MRLLVVASEVPPTRSGVARSVERIIDGARSAGHNVETRSYADARTWIRHGMRLSSLGVRLGRDELESHDLIHLHGPAPSVSDVVLLRHALRPLRVPMVYTHHFTIANHATLTRAHQLYDRMARALAGAADSIIVTTPTYRSLVESGLTKRSVGTAIDVIPWGHDPVPQPVEPRSADPERDLTVLVLGQMRPYKGHGLAVEALADLPGIRLTLAGGGPLEVELAAKANRHANLEVVLNPGDGRVDALYRSSDVVLLPARSSVEAFGIVLVEGMARGCVPVVASLPGLGDVVGDVGVSFAVNDPNSLRSTILSLADNRDDLALRSKQAIDRSGKFHWTETVTSHLDLYERTVSTHRWSR